MIKLAVYFVLIVTLDAAKILAVIPTPAISHQVVFRPITQELAKRGHEVVIITPDPVFSKEDLPANLREIDVHDVSYNTWNDEYFKLTIGSDNLLSQIEAGFSVARKVFEMQMKLPEVQDIIKTNNHFDVLLLEACARSTLALSHIFKAPVIQISSFGAMIGTHKLAGAPTHPHLYPSLFNQRQYNLTNWEKIQEFYTSYYVENLFQSIEHQEDKLIKNIFGADIPPLNKLYDNIHMWFLNVHPIWASNQPVPSNIIYIGGIHMSARGPLPEALQSFLDLSHNGVIYLSFGTNVRSSQVPRHVVQAMVKVFSELKYTVLWKWDDDRIEVSKNVKIVKWVPQTDVLHHPNIKLFITQGGLQSTQEAISAGVPLIGIPTIGDQWHNVEKYVYHNIGIRLEMDFLTAHVFKSAILSVVEDESYKKNIIKLRTLMCDQPLTALQRAIWWIEYVLRHGGALHLRTPAANMSWAKYYELKLIGIVLTVILLLCLTAYIITSYTYRIISKVLYTNTKEKLV